MASTTLRPPTPAALSNWYMEQPEGDYTCTGCGKVGPRAYIQPQHPFFAGGVEGTALCMDCINMIHHLCDLERKRELAIMPKCEACGRRRGTWTVGYSRVLLCGYCKTRVLRGNAKREKAAVDSGLAYLAMFDPGFSPGREEILTMARTR